MFSPQNVARGAYPVTFDIFSLRETVSKQAFMMT